MLSSKELSVNIVYGVLYLFWRVALVVVIGALMALPILLDGGCMASPDYSILIKSKDYPTKEKARGN